MKRNSETKKEATDHSNKTGIQTPLGFTVFLPAHSRP